MAVPIGAIMKVAGAATSLFKAGQGNLNTTQGSENGRQGFSAPMANYVKLVSGLQSAISSERIRHTADNVPDMSTQ